MSLSSMLPEELECFKAPMVQDSDSKWEPEEGEDGSAFDAFDFDFLNVVSICCLYFLHILFGKKRTLTLFNSVVTNSLFFVHREN